MSEDDLTGDSHRTAERALELALRTNVSLDMHIKNCDSRANELRVAMQDRFDTLGEDIDGMRSVIVRAGWGVTGLLLTVVAALVTFIIQLLHNGAHF